MGKNLFFDPRLSADGTVACAPCHRPALYGTDALPKSIGVEHRVNARNAPTVLNAALHFKAHWIDDRTNVEALPGYETAFAQAFPNDWDPVRPENWGKALGPTLKDS